MLTPNIEFSAGHAPWGRGNSELCTTCVHPPLLASAPTAPPIPISPHSVAGYLYLRILGHDAPEKPLPVRTPDNPTAPGLPKLNPSQQDAVKSVLAQPLALIQGKGGASACF